MYRVTIVSTLADRTVTTGDVCPNANEVRRYLYGRVRDVRAEVGEYETRTARGRFWRPGDPDPVLRVKVEHLPRVG
jgi:hypothetical protein